MLFCVVCFETPVGNGRDDNMCHRCGDEIERTLRQESVEIALAVAAIENERRAREEMA